LHIVPSLELGGAARQLAYLASGMQVAGFACDVIALKASRSGIAMLHSRGIEPIVLNWRGPLDAVSAWQLRGHIRDWKPAVVHLWSLTNGGCAAAVLARACGVKRLVISIRSVDGLAAGTMPWLGRAVRRRADRLIVNSAALRDACLAAGLEPTSVQIIPCGVALCEKTSMSRAELLERLGLPAEAKIIAFLGSLTRKNRLKELIWATDQLKAVETNAHLLIVGDGLQRGALERYSRLNHIEDRVHFLGFRSDGQCILPHVDVLWQASAGSGQSSAILEAMAASVPVVAADSAGNRELIVPGQSGYLVPASERAGFARCTLPLLENPQLAAQMGATGRSRALKFHQLDQMLASYLQVYRQLLEPVQTVG
jgi:glycosyltransferase involved in cell wall biosynthesis